MYHVIKGEFSSIAFDYSQAYDPNNGGYEPAHEPAQEWADDEVPF
jgi:hypothetical protein